MRLLILAASLLCSTVTYSSEKACQEFVTATNRDGFKLTLQYMARNLADADDVRHGSLTVTMFSKASPCQPDDLYPQYFYSSFARVWKVRYGDRSHPGHADGSYISFDDDGDAYTTLEVFLPRKSMQYLLTQSGLGLQEFSPDDKTDYVPFLNIDSFYFGYEVDHLFDIIGTGTIDDQTYQISLVGYQS